MLSSLLFKLRLLHLLQNITNTFSTFLILMAIAGKLQRWVMMIVVVSTISSYFVSSTDPDPLQDVCVANYTSDVKVNGYPCKSTFSPSDFYFHGLAKRGNTSNQFGSIATHAFVMQVPGLNSQGVSMTRVDFAPGGVNPPHIHPRASEISYMLYGKMKAMFITTDDVLVSKTIKRGDIFTFPRGLIHLQVNTGKGPAAFIAGLNSQNPGVQFIAPALFASKPPVPNRALEKAFQITAKEVEKIRAKLSQTQY